MQRPYIYEHADWFKPYVAGYYAEIFLSQYLTRQQVEGRLEELLELGRIA